MSEIHYRNIKAHIAGQQSSAFDPVYLLFGDAFLCRQTLDMLLNTLLPDTSRRQLSLETIDAAEAGGIDDALERLNTYSFFGGTKVVLIKNAPLLPGPFNAEKHFEKIRTAYEQGQMQKAARLFFQLLKQRQIDIRELSGADIGEKLSIDPAAYRRFEGIDELWRYCLENGPSESGGGDAVGALKSAVEKGFPKHHHLIVTATGVDRRTAFYKAVKAAGTVIDCAVPTGSRKADRDEQRKVLVAMVKEALSKCGKSMAPAAFDLIFEMTGFNLPVFMANVDKLIDFSGDRSRIGTDDVKDILDRNREDPIYEFTGAVAQKDTDQALYYLSSLLASGYHYLQLFTALVNQIRRLLLVRDFIDQSGDAGWQPRTPYDRFRDRVLPAVIEYDKHILQAVAESDESVDGKGKGRSRKGVPKTVSDLMIVKNPKNPFPVYQQFLNAERFTLAELKCAMINLSDADIRLKTSGHTPYAVLEALVIQICRKPSSGRAL